ncbi:histidinol-phosphate transaminase [Alicyclobacillus cellulosilyticus]|nr:histidinol-phosphate transaminase [Alicyclobacillus cellulosilyticus]
MMTAIYRVRAGIEHIEPYVPGLTDDELKARYGLSEVVKLNANENALGPSPLALAAIQQELQVLHHYPDGASFLLRDEIARFHGVRPEQVLVGNGSDELIKLLAETFLEPEDEVVMPFPSFSQYAFGASVMRAKTRLVPLGPGFTYDVEALAAAVTERTKLVFCCSPNNPTGTVMTQAEAEWLLAQLPEHVVLVIDAAYNDYSRNPKRVMGERLLHDPRVVILHTFSKLYGLAGLRVGYGLAHAELWSFVNRVREPFNVNRLAQRAAAAALQDEAHRQASQELALRSKRFYLEVCQALGLEAPEPEGNFILVRTGDGRATAQAMMARGVMVRTNFAGLDEYVRITFGTDRENELCAEALRAVVGR